jgi:hypothetical protein
MSSTGNVRRNPPHAESHDNGGDAPKKGGDLVVLHDAVGNVNLGWQKNRVVLSEDYNDGDPDHPERQLSEGALKRLTDLGAVREATGDEVKAAQAAKKQAEEAKVPFTGYFIPDAPPPAAIETSARSG